MKIRDIINMGNLSFPCEFTDFEQQIKGFKIDSRQIEKGDVFIALKGQFVSGEDYVSKALENGAICAIVSKAYEGEEKSVLLADDVLKALGEIAKNYIRNMDIKLIAVSGSVGKTSTKEAIYSVLSQKYKTFKTKGNFNSDIGLPLTLLSIEEDYEYGVIEMGMEKAGEIAYLSDITMQNMAVLTNIGSSHIASFGSREGIFKEKMSIAKNLDENGVLFLNGEDDFLKNVISDTFKVVHYGANTSDIYVEDIVVHEDGTHFTLSIYEAKYPLRIEALGIHQAKNLVPAVAIAKYIGMEDEDILHGVKNIKNVDMRFEIMSKNGIMYIKDYYNASYESFKNALESFATLPGKRKIAVVGNINECGDLLEKIHTDLGMLLNEYALDEVFFVGEFMKYAHEVYRGKKRYFDDVIKVREYLSSYLMSGDAVLMKASRFMEFERILE